MDEVSFPRPPRISWRERLRWPALTWRQVLARLVLYAFFAAVLIMIGTGIHELITKAPDAAIAAIVIVIAGISLAWALSNF